VRGRSESEVADLYRRYGYFVLRRCQLVLRDRSAAQDAAQEVFLKVLRTDVPISEIARPLGWLYRITDNVCFDSLRRRKAAPLTSDTMEEVPGVHPSVRIEDRDAALAVLAELDERDQRICLLAFVDGMTQSQIAEEISQSRVTINKRIQAIRARATSVLASRDSSP
jgi:RNA polymerase sigma-70 factor, ECF subfamily